MKTSIGSVQIDPFTACGKRVPGKHARQRILQPKKSGIREIRPRLRVTEIIAGGKRGQHRTERQRAQGRHRDVGRDNAQRALRRERRQSGVALPRSGDQEAADHEEHRHGEAAQRLVREGARRSVASGQDEAVIDEHERCRDEAEQVEAVLAARFEDRARAAPAVDQHCRTVRNPHECALTAAGRRAAPAASGGRCSRRRRRPGARPATRHGCVSGPIRTTVRPRTIPLM